MTPTPLWELDAVSLAGDVRWNQRHARPRLDRVSLSVNVGVTAILGPSGAGKTSLLNLLVGFETPSSGRISPEPASLAPLLFWSPPDYGLWPHLTVQQHLEAVCPGGETSHRSAVLCAAFQLEHVAASHPATLSQGERSRLSIARALASDAVVLVLDEPLIHVEAVLQRSCWDVIREELRGMGGQRSLIFSTHQPDIALREADRVVLMSEGRIIAEGAPEVVYREPPSRLAAELMGPCDWMTPEECQTWMPTFLVPTESAAGVAVRPERLVIEPASGNDFVVETRRSVGAWEDLELVHRPTGRRRWFTHRQHARPVAIGTCVTLRLLALLACLWITGCQDEAGPSLSVIREETWLLPPEGARIPAPRAVTVGPKETIYVLDNVGRVLAYDVGRSEPRQWWMPEHSVGKPERILELSDGRLAVADTHYHRVILFEPDGRVALMFGSKGNGPGQFIYPVAIAEDDRQNLYVCEYGGHDRVQVFRPDGTFVSEFGSFGVGPGQFQRPSGILWRNGRLYIADAFNNRIQVFDQAGRHLELPEPAFTADLHYPYDVCASSAGEFYVVEYGAGRVTKFDAQGRLVGRFGQTGNGPGQFDTPWGLGVSPTGDVLVADTGNRRITRLQFSR